MYLGKAVTKGRGAIPITSVVDYGVETPKGNKKSWDEKIRTLMMEFGFTKEEKLDWYIDAVIKDTLSEVPNASDDVKYKIAHSKFKKLFKEKFA